MKKKTVKAPAKKLATPRKKAAAPKRSSAKIYNSESLAKIIAQGMAEKKAEKIAILDLRKITGAPADFFVISHATSDKQVEAIADSAEEEVKKTTGETPGHREGYANLEWVLLDYFDVVAHVFKVEKRDFYAVEDLWGDAKIIKFKAS